jgi:hypothetical protein
MIRATPACVSLGPFTVIRLPARYGSSVRSTSWRISLQAQPGDLVLVFGQPHRVIDLVGKRTVELENRGYLSRSVTLSRRLALFRIVATAVRAYRSYGDFRLIGRFVSETANVLRMMQDNLDPKSVFDEFIHPKEFRLQQIQSGAKDPVSLRRKLTERGPAITARASRVMPSAWAFHRRVGRKS